MTLQNDLAKQPSAGPISSLRGATVMVATDLSPASDEALLEGDKWARALHGRLVVLHVVPFPLRSNMLFPQNATTDLGQLAELEPRIANAITERVKAKTGRAEDDFEVRVDSGAVDATIARRAEEMGVGLLVVGSHGAEGLGRRILGSVADRVIRHAHCAVLVARWQAATGRILATTDFSDSSFPAIEAAAEFAQLSGSKLTLFHAISRMNEAFSGDTWGGAVPWPTQEAQSNQEITRQVEDALQKLVVDRGIVAEIRVREGAPAAAIVRAAEECSAELVVIGTRGRTGLSRLLLGSVAEKVVRAAPCSVLAVRLGEGDSV